MRLYTASSEETMRARKLLKEWAGDGLLSKAQYQHLEGETASELRTTNIFMRLILFLFTLIIAVTAAPLFFEIFLSRPSNRTTGVVLIVFAAIYYTATEAAASKYRLFRYGIEEALAACSVGFLCLGIQTAFFSDRLYSVKPDGAEFLVPAVGAVFSLWIWRRFDLWYAFPAAMIFAIFLPGYWNLPHAAQHVIVAGLYTLGLVVVVTARSHHRFDFLDDTYSLAEALLWLGIYLAINLKLSTLDLPGQLWTTAGNTRLTSEFARPFYWTTWALIWCLPPMILTRGIRRKDRSVMAVGAIAAILTFISNKPYLGWQRHTWDPMLLGILLAGVALIIRRWLARGPGGILHGFTAERLSGKDKHWMNAGSAVLGLLTPDSVTPAPQTSSAGVGFGGGSSGGGGASSEF